MLIRHIINNTSVANIEALMTYAQNEGRPVCFPMDGDHKTVIVEEDKE